MSTKKVEEALAHIKEAEKNLKTGFMKWKPDYDLAADEYNSAATCYKTIRQHKECRECLMKAAENYKINRSFYSAAKCLDQAALISKELNDYEAVFKLCERSATMHQEHGTPDTAALCLDKGAKIIEAHLPEQALHMYSHAVDIVMTEDRPRQASEFQCKVSRLLVKLKQFDAASDAIRREMGFHQQAGGSENSGQIGRLAVCLVLVQLARGDHIAAEKAYREWGSYCEAEECNTVEMIIQAYDEDDGDLAVKALKSPFITHMDVEYAKLARSIKTPQGSKKKDTGGAGALGGSTNVDNVAQGIADSSLNNDDDEFDLC